MRHIHRKGTDLIPDTAASTTMLRVAAVLFWLAGASALRPAIRPVAAPRCAATQMSLPSRRSVVAGAFSAVLFGSEAQAKGAPPAPPKDPNAIDWAELGLSREALGLPPDPNAKKEEPKRGPPKRAERPPPAAKPKAIEKPKDAAKPKAEKPKPAEKPPKAAGKPKAAEAATPAETIAAKPAAKGKGGKAKPKNELGLDLDELGLSEEALGLKTKPKPKGPPKPPKPGEKPKPKVRFGFGFGSGWSWG